MARKRDFEHHFEGSEQLDGLLDLSGSSLDTNEVVGRFAEGVAAGVSASSVIPTLFDDEPQFPDPEIARRLYQNLLGLWDLVASGRKLELGTPARQKREKREKPTPPEPFDPEQGPTSAFVEAAWKYLEELPEGDARALERLNHAFENRQDGMIQWLDEAGLSDEAYATARYLLFELFAMLELGWPGGVGNAPRAWLEAQEPAEAAPSTLVTYVDEALYEAGQDEEVPLSSEQIAEVRSRVGRGLRALWNARSRS